MDETFELVLMDMDIMDAYDIIDQPIYFLLHAPRPMNLGCKVPSIIVHFFAACGITTYYVDAIYCKNIYAGTCSMLVSYWLETTANNQIEVEVHLELFVWINQIRLTN